MASEYRIHRPYALATLPRPLDHTDGRIVARQVYGQRDDQRKRKRTELAVGVDGEAASIYDASGPLLHDESQELISHQVPASRLLTSYPIPPQESFTCPPYSIRIRRSSNNDVLRYTFIATRDASSNRMTLFKDVVHPDGKTTSTSVSQALPTPPVRYITSSPSASQKAVVDDVVAVCQDGEVVHLSGETLTMQWSSSAQSAVQDVVPGDIDGFEVQYVSSGSLSELKEGIFKGRPEIFSALPRTLDLDPSLLFMITKSVSRRRMVRHLVVLAAMPASLIQCGSQKLIPLDVSPIGTPLDTSQEAPACEVDIQSGLLMELAEGSVTIYDLSGAVPKHKSTVSVAGAASFLRLSRPFILAASLEWVGLYNYQYCSIHANASLDLSELPLENQSPRSCQLISHLRGQNVVVALVDNMLVSIQVEPPKSHGKRRREGLLIDSIGRGVPVEIRSKRLKSEASSMEFSRHVPGTMTASYLDQYNKAVQAADELLSTNELSKWEDFLRKKFEMKLREATPPANEAATNGEAATSSQEQPEWAWLMGVPYPQIDRRWIVYAISQVLSMETTGSKDQRPRLRLMLPDSNVTTYLVVTGNLSMFNLKLALRDSLSSDMDDKMLAGDVVECIVDADPSMTLLLNYLQATKLGEAELLLAMRTLMRSMELMPGAKKLGGAKQLTAGPLEGPERDEMELDDLERQLAATEHYLGDESSSRSRGLTLAFSKLWRLPVASTVRTMRAMMQTEEILALIYLLRVELVRGAWTSLYVDQTGFESEGNDAPPDGVIALIADLLGRCLDAIGAGGWLFNDNRSWADKTEAGDFITALKLEVAAALEGIEEAVTLNGVIGEVVRFGLAAQKSWAARQTRNTNKPVGMQLDGRESRMLPLGLKTKQLPLKEKVVSGSEIVQRSMRETGHLISQKVGAYSLEKLIV